MPAKLVNRQYFAVRATVLFLFVYAFVGHNQYVKASTAKINQAHKHMVNQDFGRAHEALNSISFSDLDPNRMALIELFRGLLFREQKDFDHALERFDKSLQIGGRNQEVAFYFKALTQAQMNRGKPALATLDALKNRKPSSFVKRKADLLKAELLVGQGGKRQAEKLFSKLERKMRGSQEHPEILLNLLSLNHEMGRKSAECRYARKLYRKYPLYEPVAHWGLSWGQNIFHGKALACENSLSDQQYRIKRLQWMGGSEKAWKELKEFEKIAKDKFTYDMALAEYLVNDGMVKEAFQALVTYYGDSEKRKDFDYLSLLAKAAFRSGDFQTAVGIYLQAANDLKGNEAKRALFRAAFTSYQYQDYDGAIRRFQEIQKKYPYSSLAKQANWYVPWINYLRGRYQKAYSQMATALKRRRSKLPRSISSTKVKYWMARSLEKVGHKKTAKDLFLEVSQDEYIGYYSIAAVQRLKKIYGPRSLSSLQQKKISSLNENWLAHRTMIESVEDAAIEATETSIDSKKRDFSAEWEKLPFMREYLESGKPSAAYAGVSEPEFREHIARARDLAMVGLGEYAKWELYSVESRTRKKEDLKTLMFEYTRNEIFHRSSYIGTTSFADDRAHLGLHIGAPLWQHVYPRAYEDLVLKSANEFKVEPEFIWSIMKAETNYRPDAFSPVGARGLMQVMTHTGRKVASLMGKTLEGEDLFKPKVGIDIGTRYLMRNLTRFKGKIPLAAAAYNGGPHRVHQWLNQFGKLEMDEFIEHIPFIETRNYVKKVTRYYTLYNLLYNKDASASDWLAENVNVYIEGTPPTKETWEVL